jgi:DNA-directed RNA polymerase subunit RPC12/RpoP
MKTKKGSKKPSIKVVCMECGAQFSTKSMLPECPKCGGSDIEPR